MIGRQTDGASCRLRPFLTIGIFMTRPSVLFRASSVIVVACAFAGAVVAETPSPSANDAPNAGKSSEGLSPDLFYRLLLGDVALQRGDAAVAARAYLDAAREAHDARIAKRATEIALSSRQRTLAQE